jgi:hypothetical protein
MSSDQEASFGRRGAKRPLPVTAAAASNSPSEEASVTAVAWLPGGKHLGGILVGIGIVVFLYAVHVVAMKGFGRALDQHWQQNFGYPDIESAYHRTARRDAGLDEAHNHCKARSDFVQLGPAERSALEGFDGLYSGETALARAALYLSCLTAQKPARFCGPAHKAHLTAALSDYYRLMAQVREERYLQTTSPFAVERGMLISPPGGGRFGATQAPPSAKTDPRVIDGLRALIVGGYVTRRDIEAWFAVRSTDLPDRLRGVEPGKANCP